MGKRITTSGYLRNRNSVSGHTNFLAIQQIVLTVACLVLLWSYASVAWANSYTTSPLIIEKTAAGRSVSSDSITVINNSDRQLRLYPTVNEVTIGTGGEVQSFVDAVFTNRPTAITSWLEVSRARFVIPAGETKSLPIKLTVHPNAEPGTYHALISFPSGTNRAEAEAKVEAGGVPATLIRVEVPDNRVEALALKSVAVERFMLTDSTRTIAIELENEGDVPINPAGEIVFYNQRGQEVAASVLSEDPALLQPAERRSFQVAVPESVGWGKHRASLNIAYGANQRAFLQDTVFFNVLPWYMLVALFLLLLVPGLLLAWHVHRRQGIVEPDGIHNVALFTRHGTATQSVHHDINLKDTK